MSDASPVFHGHGQVRAQGQNQSALGFCAAIVPVAPALAALASCAFRGRSADCSRLAALPAGVPMFLLKCAMPLQEVQQKEGTSLCSILWQSCWGYHQKGRHCSGVCGCDGRQEKEASS